MAKDREKIEDKANEPVANCDQLPMAADIQPMIRVIRGQQVIIDRDLALLYGVETRALNQAVKRNIERFPDDFMFQLDKEDVEILKSQNVTSSWGGDRRLPYAFTEQGIAMLSSVLKSQTAVEANIRIMRAFVSMRRFIATNAQYPPVRIERFNKAHDRFLLIDDEVYHIGASIKDLGKKWFGFTLMRDIPASEIINRIKD